MAPKKENKVPQIKSASEAEVAIVEYLRQVNRPYNTMDISLNMKTVSKTVAQKALAALSERNEITAKAYGKQTIFFAKQEALPSDDQEDHARLQAETVTASEEIKTLKDRIKMLISHRDQLATQTKTEDLAKMTEALASKNDKMEAHLATLQEAGESTQVISKVELEHQSKLHATAWALWQARRRKFRDIMDLMMPDGGNAERQTLLEDLTGDVDESDAAKALEEEAKERITKRRRIK